MNTSNFMEKFFKSCGHSPHNDYIHAVHMLFCSLRGRWGQFNEGTTWAMVPPGRQSVEIEIQEDVPLRGMYSVEPLGYQKKTGVKAKFMRILHEVIGTDALHSFGYYPVYEPIHFHTKQLFSVGLVYRCDDHEASLRCAYDACSDVLYVWKCELCLLVHHG